MHSVCAFGDRDVKAIVNDNARLGAFSAGLGSRLARCLACQVGQISGRHMFLAKLNPIDAR